MDLWRLMLEAAVMGQGVVVGWTPLVEGMIASGQLV
jgi:hypothetical protein